ncbi:DoxX family membrane protein [Acetobacteraceae bacterium]|nr:DoxX family membrane protein [Candidatus Parcubacteria bacterium]
MLNSIFNPFPDLFMLGFFAPTLIRLSVGLLFVYIGYMQWRNREVIAQMRFPIVGSGMWIALVFMFFHFAVGLMLIAGFYTQIAALLGIAGSLKGLILNRRHPTLIIVSNGTVVLAIVMLLSLLVTGAGAFAFDIPQL